MCKNHDEQHYPREIREAAMIIACGNAMDRDMILRTAAHNGLAQLLEDEVECMPLDLSLKALKLLNLHFRLQAEAMAALKLRCHERWDDELEREIEAMNANSVD